MYALLHYIIETKFYYGVRIATGNVGGAGTNDKGVYTILVGNQGATKKIYLLDYLSILSSIEGGTCDDLLVETDANLEDVQVVILGNEKNWFLPTNDYWYINYTTIYHYNEGSMKAEKKFPCYHWIGDNEAVSITSATSKTAL